MSKQAQAVAKAKNSPTSLMTREDLKSALPRGVSISFSDTTVQKINNLLQDEYIQETFKENLLSFTHVMKEGKFTADSYVNAVNYVSRKLMGDTNETAYAATFPQKYQDFITKGMTDKVISARVASFNKSKLVQLVMEQTVVPVWLYNQHIVQQAINMQAHIMNNEKASFKVRSDAANSLLTHLKQPEKQKIELDIGMKEDSTLADLRDATKQLVLEQQRALKSGKVNVHDVAQSKIVTEEPEDIIEGELVDNEVSEQ